MMKTQPQATCLIQVSALILLCLITLTHARGQQVRNSLLLDLPGGAFQAQDEEMRMVVARLTRAYKIPTGIEQVPEDPEAVPVKINVSSSGDAGTLRELLNKIVKADSRYKWEEAGGVINILPAVNNNSLLDTKVGILTLHEVTANEGVNALLDLPEIRAEAARLGLNRQEVMHFPSDVTPADSQRFNLVLRNVTMRQALNALVKRSGQGNWIHYLHGNGNKYFSLRLQQTPELVS